MYPQKIPLISLIFTEAIRANQCQSVGDFCSFKSTSRDVTHYTDENKRDVIGASYMARSLVVS